MQVLPTAPSPTVTHLMNLDALIDDYFFSSETHFFSSSFLPITVQHSADPVADSGFKLQKV